MTLHTRLFALIAVLVIVGTACGNDDAATTTAAFGAYDQGGNASESTTTAAATTTTMAGPSDDRDRGDEGTNSAPIGTGETPADLGRSIVYTATIEIEVDDVIAAGAAAQQAVAPLGGLLFGQETTTGPDSHSILTIKVRPEDFQEALDRLSGIGTLVSQSVTADDVTERVVDLQSRITTAEASVERLRTFLSQATELKDVAALEAELLQRETDLELLRGQLRTIETAVSLATITIILTEPTPEPALELVQTAYLGHDGGQGCPGSGDITFDEGDLATFCYEITNTGDTSLSEVEARDPGVDADAEDLVVVDGDLAALLLPGDRVILAFETTAEPATYPAPSVTATAVDADGTPLRVSIDVVTDLGSLTVVRDTSLPGFSDALNSSWHGLQRVFGVIVVAGGAVIPFLWLPVLLILAALWIGRRSRKTTDTETTHPKE